MSAATPEFQEAMTEALDWFTRLVDIFQANDESDVTIDAILDMSDAERACALFAAVGVVAFLQTARADDLDDASGAGGERP